MKLLLIDDHDLFSISLQLVLERFEKVESVTILKDVSQLFKHLSRTKYTLILLDIHLGKMNGLEVGRQIKERYPELPLVFITGFDLSEYQYQANKIGANGFFNKSISPDELFANLEGIANGETILSEDAYKLKARLSERQMEILILVSRGYTHPVIAEKLDLSKRTIEAQLQEIYKKLEVGNAAGAVYKGLHLGIIPHAVNK